MRRFALTAPPGITSRREDCGNRDHPRKAAMTSTPNLSAMADLATPWTLRVVVTLGVAEALAAGPLDADSLADLTGSDPVSLARALRFLAAKGIFEEHPDGVFHLNDAARGLLEPGPTRGLDLRGHGGRLAQAWSGLLESVRSGRPTYADVFGKTYWEDLEEDATLSASYDTLMSAVGNHAEDSSVLVDDDWGSVAHVVDVGGGTGRLLAEILRAHPDLTGTLVDLPRTIQRAREATDADVLERITFAPQSFLEALPTGGDVYLLYRVLLDWPDEEARILLANCAAAAAPHLGRVVVVGGVTPGSVPPGAGLLLSILHGGRTRSLDEFRILAESAGLRVTKTGTAGERFVAETRPVAW